MYIWRRAIWRATHPGRPRPRSSLNPARTLPPTFTLNGYSTMLLLRDPSPRLAQDSQGFLPPSHGPSSQCKDESSTPRNLLRSPFQNTVSSLPATDTPTLKREDDSSDTMDRQNEAGGSQSRPNDQCVPYTR